jgi:hypothetical protein
VRFCGLTGVSVLRGSGSLYAYGVLHAGYKWLRCFSGLYLFGAFHLLCLRGSLYAYGVLDAGIPVQAASVLVLVSQQRFYVVRRVAVAVLGICGIGSWVTPVL